MWEITTIKIFWIAFLTNLLLKDEEIELLQVGNDLLREL